MALLFPLTSYGSGTDKGGVGSGTDGAHYSDGKSSNGGWEGISEGELKIKKISWFGNFNVVKWGSCEGPKYEKDQHLVILI